jgi:hypothetical protein
MGGVGFITGCLLPEEIEGRGLMVRVPYRGVPKGEVKEEPKAPDPPIRKGETKPADPPIRRASKIGDGSNG